jgi:hypothetical protein
MFDILIFKISYTNIESIFIETFMYPKLFIMLIANLSALILIKKPFTYRFMFLIKLITNTLDCTKL